MEEAPGVLALASAVFPSQPRTPPPRLQRLVFPRPSPGFALLKEPSGSPHAPAPERPARSAVRPSLPAARGRPPPPPPPPPSSPSPPHPCPGPSPSSGPSLAPGSRFSSAPLCAKPVQSRNTRRDLRGGGALWRGGGAWNICSGKSVSQEN